MKRIAYLLIFVFVFAFNCKDDHKQHDIETESNTPTDIKSNTKPNTATNTADIPFLKDVKSLEKDTSSNPIDTFKDAAKISAKEVVTLNKDNIKDALTKARNFKNAVITVDNHTIVKLNLEDCKASGAWGTCMPKAEGYIKKGDLVYQNDYANNIIGLPDNQERLLYLF